MKERNDGAAAARKVIARNDFEVSEGQPHELAPGVVVTISQTNVEQQHVSGWVYLQNEYRVLWLKNHALLQPLTFSRKDGEQHDIVFTRVRQNDAAGYLIQRET